MASMEQKKDNERVLRFIENQKREKEAALDIIRQLERKLEAKQKLDLEIEELMKQLEGGKDNNLQEEMKKINEELKDEVEDLEAMNQTLIMKERECHDELQEIRNEFIQCILSLEGERDMSSAETTIIVKRMGELNVKPFRKACMERFPAEEAMLKSVQLLTSWQDHLRKPEWHPFKIVVEGGNTKEIIDEEDELLIGARKQLGDEVCEAIITASKEMNEYNASGRYTVPELWNLKEDRKATLKEVIAYAKNEGTFMLI